jgi:Peroxisomal biogenesis factor 11 (PEX11).
VDPVLRYLAVGRQLGYAGYLTLDTVSVIDIIGFRKLESAKRLQESAYRAWGAGLLCSALAGLYTLFRLQEKEKSVDRKEGEGVVEAKKIEKYVLTSTIYLLYWNPNTNPFHRERAAARIQLVSDLCDMTIPASAIGIVALDDGLVGIAGTVSSLIGIWSQWRKTA